MLQPTTSHGGESSCDLDDGKKETKIDSSDKESSGSDTNVEATHPAVLTVFRTDNMMQPTTSDGGNSLRDLDDDIKRIEIDSSNTESSDTDDDVVVTHPAVRIAFRTESILEEICSYLECKDLKQFRLVSRSCNNEGRRTLIMRDKHWVVVESKNDKWQLELGQVLTKLEETAIDGGENPNRGWIFKRLESNHYYYSLGQPSFLLQWGHYLRNIHLKVKDDYAGYAWAWHTFGISHVIKTIFKRLELHDWYHCCGQPSFLQHWGHYLRKIHLNVRDHYEDYAWHTFGVSHVIKTIHFLLSVCCPNLDELVVGTENLKNGEHLSQVFINELDSLEFPSPPLKLKWLRINELCIFHTPTEEREVLLRFFTRLVRAAGTALETLEIEYFCREDIERGMLESLALNVGVSNFQSLKEITLESPANVAHLSRTVQNCFPRLTKLMVRGFFSAPFVIIRPESFPALKSLTIFGNLQGFNSGTISHFLQNFLNLELLTISLSDDYDEDERPWPVIPDPILPPSIILRSLTFISVQYNLRLLRSAVNVFSNLVTLNLLAFGRSYGFSVEEPEYSFGELIETISPLSRLQHLYVNYPFHTSPQLADAIQQTSNLRALQTIILYQATHDDYHTSKPDFNVSHYLTTSDPGFQYILNCDGVKRLKFIQLLNFRLGTTQEELKKETSANGGHVRFGTICNCYTDPWSCTTDSCLRTCPGWKPIYHA